MTTEKETESELALLLDELTGGAYGIEELKNDMLNKISGRSNDGSIVEKIRIQTGKNLITHPRFMILFMRYWNYIDMELKGN